MHTFVTYITDFSTNRKMCKQKKALYAYSLDNLQTQYGFSTKCDVSYTFRWKQHLSKRLQAGTSPVARSHILSRRENAVWFLPKVLNPSTGST